MTRRRSSPSRRALQAVGTGFALVVGGLALDRIGNVLIPFARAVGLR